MVRYPHWEEFNRRIEGLDNCTFYAFGFFFRTLLYNLMPSMSKMPSTMMPKTPNSQLKVPFSITKNTTAKRIRVAPSFQMRM